MQPRGAKSNIYDPDCYQMGWHICSLVWILKDYMTAMTWRVLLLNDVESILLGNTISKKLHHFLVVHIVVKTFF